MAMRTLIYIMLLLLIILGVSFAIQSGELEKERAERVRLAENLEQYGRMVSTLTLTKSEIEQELEKKNKTLTEADSILKAKNRRITQLEQLVKTRIVIRDTDTVYVPLLIEPFPIPIPTDSMYRPQKFSFSETKSCITIKGFILSEDPQTKLAITERSSDIKVYDIYIKRKWYQIFRPKYERFVESNCGEVSIEKIYKTKSQ